MSNTSKMEQSFDHVLNLVARAKRICDTGASTETLTQQVEQINVKSRQL